MSDQKRTLDNQQEEAWAMLKKGFMHAAFTTASIATFLAVETETAAAPPHLTPSSSPQGTPQPPLHSPDDCVS